jgi:hypothetical protein
MTRPSMVDDSGTPDMPAEDGTFLQTSFFTAIFNAIDAMWSGTTQVFAGVLTVDGFGSHNFSAGGSGANALQIRNTAAGTSNRARLQVGNDTDAALARLDAFSSTFTPTAAAFADGVELRASGVGGLTVHAQHASGVIRLMQGGAVVATLDAASLYGAGTSPLYAVTLADADNTASEITVLTATVTHAVSDGDVLLSDLIYTYRNNSGASRTIQIDVLYGGVEATLLSETVQTGPEAYSCLELRWIRNGADLLVALGSGRGIEEGSGGAVAISFTEGVRLSGPTFTAGQTLSIKVTHGVADAGLYFRPEAGSVRHLFA